jgi:hypothetical protein
MKTTSEVMTELRYMLENLSLKEHLERILFRAYEIGYDNARAEIRQEAKALAKIEKTSKRGKK